MKGYQQAAKLNPNSCGGVPRMQKLRSLLVGDQGYQRFLLSKPGVGQK